MGVNNTCFEDEELICKAEKNSALILFSSFLILMGIFGLPSIFRSFVMIFQGNYIQENAVDFYISSVTFLFGWALPFIIILLFANGEIIVTNKKVYIKKGALGYQIEIPIDSISGIEQCSFSTKGGKQHYLLVYLHDGSRFKSDTHFSKVGLDNIVEILLAKDVQKFSALKRKTGKNINYKSDLILYKKQTNNLIVPILTVFNILLSVSLFVVTFTKFN
jgi:hypothetical protein